METFEVQFLASILMTMLISSVHGFLPTFFMDEWCATTLDLGVQGVEAGRLLLRPPERGMRYLNCFVFLKAPRGKRLSLQFRGFDIQSPFDCNTDHLQLFDDRFMRSELTGRMCNSGQKPEGLYTTTAEDGTIRLFKKNYLGDQIEVIVTAFHLTPCRGGEFQCGNQHCIAKDLYCNDYDNCGDGSDVCLLNAGGIAGVIIAVIIIIIIIAVVVAIVVYRRQQHRRLEKLSTRHEVMVADANGVPFVMHEQHVHYVDVWDSKSALSDSRSTSSSRLSLDKSGVPEGGSSGNETALSRKGRGWSDVSGDSRHSRSRLVRTASLGGKDGQDIYAVPVSRKARFGPSQKDNNNKKNKKKGKKGSKKSLHSSSTPGGSVRYINERGLLYPPHSLRPVAHPPSLMFDQDSSFREGFKGEGESRLPIHTLDPSALPADTRRSADDAPYDQLLSFRCYSSPELSRREKVVYLYPGHPGYHRLNHHPAGQESQSAADRASLNSSRSSLVKL